MTLLSMEEEQQQPQQPQPERPRRKSWVKRTILGLVLGMVLLVVLLPALLYIPAVQDFACRTAVGYLNSTSDDLEYSVGQIRIGFPLRLRVSDVGITHRQTGQVMLHLGLLETGLDDIPISQPYFILNRVHIEDVALSMDSLTHSFGMSGQLHHLDAVQVAFDPMNYQIRLAEARIDNPDVLLYIGPSEPDSIDEESKPWSVGVERLTLHNGRVGLDMSNVSLSDALSSPRHTRYLDYHHLLCSDIDLEAERILYAPGLIQANVNLFKAREENSGLDVEQLGVNFRMEDDLIAANSIDLQLADEDYLKGDFVLDLHLLDSIPDGYAMTDLRLGIDSLNLFRLATPYLPALEPNWIAPRAEVHLSARMTPDSLELPALSLDIPGYAEVNVEGLGDHIFDNKQRSAAATLKGALTHADFLLSSFVAAPKERSYCLPDSIEVDMEATQRQQRFTARVDMKQHGEDCLQANGNYDLETEAYHLSAATWGLNVSDFVPALVADQMHARVEADGRHFAFPSKYTRLDAQVAIDSLLLVDSLGHVDYLNAIYANASLLGGNYVVDLQSQYPYAQLDTHLEGCYLRDTLSARGFLNVPHVDLARLPLGYARQGLGTIGVLSQLDIAYDWKERAHVYMRMDSLSYIDQTTHLRYDSILVSLDSEPGSLDADLYGGDASLCLRTDRSIKQLPAVLDTLMAEVKHQVEAFSFDFNAIQRKLPSLQADFQMAHQNPFYQSFEYHTGYAFKSVNLHASNDDELSVDANVIELLDASGSVDFDTLSILLRPTASQPHNLITSEPQNLTISEPHNLSPSAPQHSYAYALHALHIDPKARKTYDVHADGRIMPDSITVDLNYINGTYQTIYDVMASLAVRPDSVTLHLEKDPTLYEQPFTVNPDNFLSVMHFLHPEDRALATHARMKLQGPRDLSLNLYSRRNPRVEHGNQLLLLMRNLDLGYATEVMEWEGNAGGRSDLMAAINISPDSITADLRSGIKTFHLGDYRADTLAFNGKFLMEGPRKDVDGVLTVDSIVKLRVDADLGDSVNVHTWLEELPLPLVNTFLPSNMELSGTTTGELTMRGKDVEHAEVNAFLTMQDAALGYHDLDAQLRFCDDTLYLRNNRLMLRDYKLYGANQNPVTIRGLVDLSKDVSNPGINLNISGQKVRLIDNQKVRLKDQYICGRLPISPDIKIRGTLNRMQVSGSLDVLSGTDLQYYMSDDPLQSTSKVDQLVEFVSFRQLDHELATGGMKRRPPMQDRAEEGLNVSLHINIDRDVKVTAHLAGVDNNKVNIVGGGDLLLATDNHGDLVMNGTYDVTSGKVDYKLPILPVVKTFNIANTSNVSWSGRAPGDPIIDITATEEVRTTVNDDQGSRLVRFLVTIQISGTLEELNMTFDCTAPDDGAISSDIASLSNDERSKAAIMLLVTQTYVGPSSTSSVGLGAANAALNSVLNRQMDSMLDNMKGTSVDVGMDIYNTETGATRTSYSVKVSQNLFNDRFRATIGGQINSGGDIGQSQGARLGDMSLEWLIKKDGSHYLKLFRRTNYESVLEGELIETGVSYVQERTGYRFRQLFMPTNKKRQARINAMIQELRAKEEEEERQSRRRQLRQGGDSTQSHQSDTLRQSLPDSLRQSHSNQSGDSHPNPSGDSHPASSGILPHED